MKKKIFLQSLATMLLFSVPLGVMLWSGFSYAREVLYALALAFILIFSHLLILRRFKIQDENDTMMKEIAQTKVDASESRYRSLFETMSSGAILKEIVFDSAGKAVDFRYLSINPMAEKMLNLDRKALIGKLGSRLFPHPDKAWIETLGDIASGGKPKHLDDIFTGDGKILRRIAYSPGQGQVVTLFDDITGEVKAKKELEAEKEKLIEAIHAAEETNKLKGMFLVNMSHQIKTPLNAIIGLSEVEIELHKEPLAIRTFTSIRESARNLMGLLDDAMDYSKMEEGKLSLEQSDFCLENVLQNALTVTMPRLNGKNVEMLVSLAPDLPARIIGDPRRIWQIVKNLLDNAGRFTDEGCIVLEVAETEDRRLRIRVSDTGVGLSEEQKERLFSVFGQISRDYAPGGAGLGLSIVKKLVDMMNGTIDVESEAGCGASFTVTIPLVAATGSPTVFSLIEEAKLLRNRSILVVDDNEKSRRIMGTLFDAASTKATFVSSAEEAIDRLKAEADEGISFDLFILDHVLPGMDGIAAARKIAEEAGQIPAILMITPWSHRLLMNDVMQAGFIEVVEKPFVPSVFIQKAAAALGLRVKEISRTPKRTREDFSSSKILVAEDNAQNRDVMNQMLFLFGIVPDFAVNGKEAVEKTAAANFDLVLMDIQMPEMNGLDAARAIREREREQRKPQVPIVAMTAYTMTEDIQASLQAGMNTHIAKPVEIASLGRILENFLWNKKSPPVEGGNRSKNARDEISALEGISCVDTSRALEKLCGDGRLYARLLLGLKRTLAVPQPEYETAIAGENIAETAHFIHTLKGLAGNLCVTGLFRVASDFEEELRTNRNGREEYEKFRKACADVYSELTLKLPETEMQGGTPEKNTDGTEAELAESFASIIEPLEAGNAPAVIAILDSLQMKRFARISHDEIDELRRLAIAFEFGAILERIRSRR